MAMLTAGYRPHKHGPGCAPNVGDRNFFNLSYQAPRHFPYPPWRLVLETEPGTCDLYGDKRVCNDFSSGDHYEPEFMIRDVIASLLTGCDMRKCRTVDIGMSTGYFTAAMASLGAHVASIEPSTDLTAAFHKTVELNCWHSRVNVTRGYIGAEAEPGETKLLKGADVGKRGLSDQAGKRSIYPAKGIQLPVIAVGELVKGSLDFVKVDVDSIDVLLVQRIHRLIVAGQAEIESIVFEVNPALVTRISFLELMVNFQALNYSAFLLDTHSHMVLGEQRVYGEHGINIGAPYSWKPPAGVTEFEHVRFISHINKFDDDLGLAGWERLFPARSPRPRAHSETFYRTRNSTKINLKWWAPYNILLTKQQLIDSRPKQIHPQDYEVLKRRYQLNESLQYRFPQSHYEGYGRQ